MDHSILYFKFYTLLIKIVVVYMEKDINKNVSCNSRCV